jgi:hypothetical protein
MQVILGKQVPQQADRVETHDAQDVNVNVTYVARWGGSPGEIAAPHRDTIAPAPDPDDDDVIDGELDADSDPE